MQLDHFMVKATDENVSKQKPKPLRKIVPHFMVDVGEESLWSDLLASLVPGLATTLQTTQ